MASDFYQQTDDKSKKQEETKKEEKKGPPHDLPPHLLRELFGLKEKVGRLEGQMDVLLRLKNK